LTESDVLKTDSGRELLDIEKGQERVHRDDVKFFFGKDKDFSLIYDSTNDRLELIDDVNDLDLLRFEKSGSATQDTGGVVEIGPDTELHFAFGGYIQQDSTRFVVWNKKWRCTDVIQGFGGIESFSWTRIRDDNQLGFGTDDDITFEYDSTNAQLKVSGTDLVTETADGMTANPEADTEDGYLTIRVGTNVYQIPIYLA